MRKKGKRLVFLSVGFLFLFILVSVKKNISTSLYQTISSLVCDEERGKAVIHELVRRVFVAIIKCYFWTCKCKFRMFMYNSANDDS